MVSNLRKIIIGTAHFGVKYGINNDKENFKNLLNVINYLNKNKVELFFDCSENYHNSFRLIKKLLKLKKFQFKIIYKIDVNTHLKSKDVLKDYLKHKIKKFCKNLELKNENIILMLHNENLIFKKNFHFLYEILLNLKKEKSVLDFGYSIYNFKKLKKKIFKFKPNILQLPFNMADRSISNKELEIIKNYKIKIHARSIFLQGMLMRKFDELPKKFYKFKKYWETFEINLNMSNAEKELSLLIYVFNNKNIDKIIIGNTNLAQLQLINKIKKQKPKNFFPNIKSSKEKKYLLRPYNW